MGCLFSCWKTEVINIYEKRKEMRLSKIKRANLDTVQEIIQQTNNFAPKHRVNQGTFSEIYLCQIRAYGRVAIKRMTKYNVSVNAAKESQFLRRYKHRNVIQFHQCVEIDNQLCYIMEYVENGNLCQHLQDQNPQLNCWYRLQICLGTAQGIQYLHSAFLKSLIHGDIRTENILLDSHYVAKIGKFDQSKLTKARIPRNQFDDEIAILQGSLGYTRIPPEAFRGEITLGYDVYGFGSVLLEVLSGRPYLSPFQGFQTLVIACLDSLDEQRLTTPVK
ncbi:Chitin elicitor receptor kinase 1 [Trichoplax sp. H2]|nr:Chitin elicitor receptor kinase 1 [Trichoplax sp. H2]|eukprot:RDD38102.1 Chitin elicitor receptor kinase 1 [Trichoplax sp. H2]